MLLGISGSLFTVLLAGLGLGALGIVAQVVLLAFLGVIINTIKIIHMDKYDWSDDEVGCFELGIQWGYLVTALTSIIQMFYTTKSSLEDWTNTKDCFG